MRGSGGTATAPESFNLILLGFSLFREKDMNIFSKTKFERNRNINVSSSLLLAVMSLISGAGMKQSETFRASDAILKAGSWRFLFGATFVHLSPSLHR